MWLEYLVVGVILLVAAAWVGYRVYMSLSGKRSCDCSSATKGCRSSKCIANRLDKEL